MLAVLSRIGRPGPATTIADAARAGLIDARPGWTYCPTIGSLGATAEMEGPMATAAIPYITFAGNAREALSFYQAVFGGKVEITTFGDFNVPDAPVDGVMHGALATDEFAIYGSDAMGTDELGDPARIRITIAGDDLESAGSTFEGLSQGGKVITPLEKQMWGDVYGEVVDQYGVSWMYNIGSAAS